MSPSYACQVPVPPTNHQQMIKGPIAVLAIRSLMHFL